MTGNVQPIAVMLANAGQGLVVVQFDPDRKVYMIRGTANRGSGVARRSLLIEVPQCPHERDPGQAWRPVCRRAWRTVSRFQGAGTATADGCDRFLSGRQCQPDPRLPGSRDACHGEQGMHRAHAEALATELAKRYSREPFPWRVLPGGLPIGRHARGVYGPHYVRGAYLMECPGFDALTSWIDRHENLQWPEYDRVEFDRQLAVAQEERKASK